VSRNSLKILWLGLTVVGFVLGFVGVLFAFAEGISFENVLLMGLG